MAVPGSPRTARVLAAVRGDGASASEIGRAAGVTSPAGDPVALLRAIMDVRDRPDRGSALEDAGRRYAQSTLGETASFDRADTIVERLYEPTISLRRMDRST